jgi:hypothetical protein
MYKSLSGALAVLGLAAATLAMTPPASADGVGVGIHIGGLGLGVGVGATDAEYGYRDGYWDRGRHWHTWRDEQEMREYRRAHSDEYYDYDHDRYSNEGWRD